MRPASKSSCQTAFGKPMCRTRSPCRCPISRRPTRKPNSPRLPSPASTPGHDVASAVIRSLALLVLVVIPRSVGGPRCRLPSVIGPRTRGAAALLLPPPLLCERPVRAIGRSGVPMEDLVLLTETGGRQLTPRLDREHRRGGDGRHGSVVEAHGNPLRVVIDVDLKDYAVAGHVVLKPSKGTAATVTRGTRTATYRPERTLTRHRAGLSPWPTAGTGG